MVNKCESKLQSCENNCVSNKDVDTKMNMQANMSSTNLYIGLTRFDFPKYHTPFAGFRQCFPNLYIGLTGVETLQDK